MSVILGLSPHFINNSAALLVDGEVVYACEEERLTREKRTRRFPVRAITDGLERTGLTLADIGKVGVSVNAGIYLEHYDGAQSERLRYRPEMLYSTPSRLLSLFPDPSVIRTSQTFELAGGERLEIEWVEHHLAHAAASFFTSPYDSAAILSVDGFGEKTCVLFAHGAGNRITPLSRQEFPHSLGSFYAAMTELLGFEPNNDEWKVMGASAYGDPERFGPALRSLFTLQDDGSFEIDLSYFNFFQFHRPHYFSPKLPGLLGLPLRADEEDLAQIHYDLAAATQKVCEDVIWHMLRKLQEQTGEDAVCLGGGVAYNSVANGKVVESTPFAKVFIPPMPDDGGTSLGAALYVHHQLEKRPRTSALISNYYGPGYSDDHVQSVLRRARIRHRVIGQPAREAAERIANGQITGWFQGRLEFGDRALGNRSILADPRDPDIRDKVNATIKYRESFRPFAASVLLESAREYFQNADPTPFMEKVFKVQPDKRRLIPGVTHADGTCRIQTVTREQNALFRDLIAHFQALTGVPCVLNTSFNLKGEPIVCSPEDAIRTFMSSGLDCLFLGNCLVEK